MQNQSRLPAELRIRSFLTDILGRGLIRNVADPEVMHKGSHCQALDDK